MTLVDKLRAKRASPSAVLQKFLNVYDPNKDRIYAFTEGDPDMVFYRIFLERYHNSPSQVFVFNCSGKQGVFDAESNITTNYPACKKALFFVDKDVDDIIPITWTTTPRIFTTEFYSIENYVVSEECCRRFFRDFVKVRHVEVPIETIVEEFSEELRKFHALLLPLMAWVVAFRRRGGKLLLNNIKLGSIYNLKALPVARRRGVKILHHLESCKRNTTASPSASEVRTAYRELQALDSREFARGHFVAQWFIAFLRLAGDDLSKIVQEGAGTISFHTQISENNFIQTLTTVDTIFPDRLKTFLDCHLADQSAAPEQQNTNQRPIFRVVSRLLNLIDPKKENH